jgi:hypothetical protein
MTESDTEEPLEVVPPTPMPIGREYKREDAFVVHPDRGLCCWQAGPCDAESYELVEEYGDRAGETAQRYVPLDGPIVLVCSGAMGALRRDERLRKMLEDTGVLTVKHDCAAGRTVEQ